MDEFFVRHKLAPVPRSFYCPVVFERTNDGAVLHVIADEKSIVPAHIGEGPLAVCPLARKVHMVHVTAPNH